MKNKIINWLKKKINQSRTSGIICGLSGGIDSAVVAVLMKKAFPKNSLCVFMPCKSNPVDRKHVILLKKKFNLNVIETDLEPVYGKMLEALKVKKDKTGRSGVTPPLALANLKPRLRMITLYFYANKYNYLVAGTGNKSELTVGYFTKYGDGGVDILPIGNLLKRDVRALAKELDIPKEIIEKPPTAGLWPNQTDEKEMGITYNELDNIVSAIDSGDYSALNKKNADKVKKMYDVSAHKRCAPEIFKG